MEPIEREREDVPTPPESPLMNPFRQLREPSADELTIDISDSAIDLPLDDSERLYEDAEPLRD